MTARPSRDLQAQGEFCVSSRANAGIELSASSVRTYTVSISSIIVPRGLSLVFKDVSLNHKCSPRVSSMPGKLQVSSPSSLNEN